MTPTAPHGAAVPSTFVADTAPDSAFAAVRAVTKLRNTLRLNALFSLVTGLVGLVFAGWVAGRLGLGDTGALWVRLISAGLLGFALALAGLAGTSVRRLLPLSREVVIADLAWVAATAVLIALGAFSTSGAVIAVGLAVVVLDFALVQMWHRSRALTAPIVSRG